MKRQKALICIFSVTNPGELDHANEITYRARDMMQATSSKNTSALCRLLMALLNLIIDINSLPKFMMKSEKEASLIK